ncbi:MAG TPA: Uma2 family endonuclease [Acetobacteraceae bacterium]|nr:Uma2 family endonuclease [Acetobacteraceae bacterium]
MTDQFEFGPEWRYELVDGVIVGHAAPSADHAAILAGLTGALTRRMEDRTDGCRPEVGSGAAPKNQQRATARIPDAMIRCREHPRVTFDIVSPSELRAWRARDRHRQHLQDVEGVQEIVEVYQDEAAIHVYRKGPADAWVFEAINGLDATLVLGSVALEIPLVEIYRFVVLEERETPL